MAHSASAVTKTIASGAPYVKLDESKSQNMPVWLRKMVLGQHLRWLVRGAATLCTCCFAPGVRV